MDGGVNEIMVTLPTYCVPLRVRLAPSKLSDVKKGGSELATLRIKSIELMFS